MFRLSIDPLSGYYVSERLKNKMEEEDFTGLVFKEVSHLKKVEVFEAKV